VVEIAVDLPVVIPPAVLGVALLQTFGRRGLIGPGGKGKSGAILPVRQGNSQQKRVFLKQRCWSGDKSVLLVSS